MRRCTVTRPSASSRRFQPAGEPRQQLLGGRAAGVGEPAHPCLGQRPRHRFARVRPREQVEQRRDVAALVEHVGGEHEIPRRPLDDRGRAHPVDERGLERRPVALRVLLEQLDRLRRPVGGEHAPAGERGGEARQPEPAAELQHARARAASARRRAARAPRRSATAPPSRAGTPRARRRGRRGAPPRRAGAAPAAPRRAARRSPRRSLHAASSAAAWEMAAISSSLSSSSAARTESVMFSAGSRPGSGSRSGPGRAATRARPAAARRRASRPRCAPRRPWRWSRPCRCRRAATRAGTRSRAACTRRPRPWPAATCSRARAGSGPRRSRRSRSASSSCSTVQLERPIQRTLPSSWSSLNAPTDLGVRDVGIGAVVLVEVDPVGVERLQRGLAGGADVLGAAVELPGRRRGGCGPPWWRRATPSRRPLSAFAISRSLWPTSSSPVQ